MASHAWNDLPCGHFGNAQYDTEEGNWSFIRSPGSGAVLDALGDPQILIESPLPTRVSPGEAKHEIPSKRHERQTKDVIRRYPDLQPANALLRPLLQASEAVEGATARHDPVIGNRLSFGRVFDESLRRSAQIVAFPSGESGSALRLRQIQLQKQGWDDSKDIWLEVPVIAGEEAVWHGEGAPIQQIYFARPVESGESLLAVRLITRTVIFKPVLRRYGPGRLVTNELCEIPINRTGCVPHADVTFNPWFTRQFAIVDQMGGWSVWEFGNREARSAKCVHVCAKSSAEDDSGDRFNDGWARILWIQSPNTILLANRDNVWLYDIASGPVLLETLDLGPKEGAKWILDVGTLPGHTDMFCVLTSTHLHALSLGERDGTTRARAAVRVRHHRNPEDISLNLTSCLDGDDVLLILCSASDDFRLVYRLVVGTDGSIRMCDPSAIRLPIPFEVHSNHARSDDLDIQGCAVAQKRNANVDHTNAARLRKGGSGIFSCFLLTSDLSVHQQLYLSRSARSESYGTGFPAWKGRLAGTTGKVDDRFIVDDEADEAESPTEHPMSAFMRQRMERDLDRSGVEWTLSLQLAANHIEHVDTSAEDFADVLEKMREMLEQRSEQVLQHRRLLCELSRGEHTTSDVDQASTLLQELSTLEPSQAHESSYRADEAPGHHANLVLCPVAPPNVLGLPTSDDEASLGTTYDSIISHWISPLSQDVSARVRMTKEILARRMAAEITLASNVLRVQDSEPTQDTQESGQSAGQSQTQSQSQSWFLPMRNAQLSQASPSTPVLPTPSPTATPSLITNSSRTSLLGPAAEYSRLSRYTTFSKPAPASLPRPLAKVLAHWQPGTDPDAYDWVFTSRSINREVEAEEADSQLTEKERARLARKTERMLKRQRKENAASQQQMAASSQMPELVVSASQPANADTQRSGRNADASAVPASSQSVGMGVGTASQAAPGRFGGRPPAKKVKRKQGF